MDFTYDSYANMIGLLRDNDYHITDYHNWKRVPEECKCAILRHDIDFDMKKAVDLAEVEKDLGIKSTYFVLISSPMYNALSKEAYEMIMRIKNMGHDIGLHYDEMRYPAIFGNSDAVVKSIQQEIGIFENVMGFKVDILSMHRPSRDILKADMAIPGIINSYSKTFFEDFKYVSDSRKRWREPVLDLICSGKFDRLHILTHAFWYDETECSIHDSVLSLINAANTERYAYLKDNITDIDSIIDTSEVR